MKRYVPDTLRVLPLIAVCAACSQGTGVQLSVAPPVTLLVTNATCSVGTCDSLRILAFPQYSLATPGGLQSVELGTVATESACLTLPDSLGLRSAGPSDTAVVPWTRNDTMSLGSLLPGGSTLQASPSTRGFVPASAAGWSVTLPGDTAVQLAQACR